MSILIVDDSADIRSLFRTLLAEEVYSDEVLTAASAIDAFKYLGMADPAGAASSVDLILMDISMPEMAGVEACRWIKSTASVQDIPIIMVTAHSEVEYLEEAFEAGAADYITKSVNKFELRARVRAVQALKREMDYQKDSHLHQLEAKNQELELACLANSQMMSAVAHDLKTPFTNLIGYLDRLIGQPEILGALNDRQYKYVESARKYWYQSKVLIDRLLDISRVETVSLDLFPMTLDVLSETQSIVRSMQAQIEDAGVRVLVNLSPELHLVTADRLRFSQIMSNLLSNACKYSPKDTIVEIIAEDSTEQVRIDVSDSGVGISRSEQSRLFTNQIGVDVSSTGEAYGAGLTLVITKRLVEAQAGSIWVESEKGMGSVFSFTLPRADADNATQRTSKPAMSGSP